MRHPFKYEAAKCSEVGGDFWFPEKTDNMGGSSVEVQLAKKLCSTCPHLQECKDWGLNKEHHGIWGGLTERERVPIRRRLNIIVEEPHLA